MLRKTITYVDFDDRERTEDFYFNLKHDELVEMNLSHTGGMAKMIQKIVEAEDTKAIFAMFKDLVMRSYGIKSDDGRRFIKSDELSQGFVETEAFSVLIVEILQDPDKAITFLKGILPQSLAEEADKLALDGGLSETMKAYNDAVPASASVAQPSRVPPVARPQNWTPPLKRV